MISIILVEPEHSGNIGAVARVMKNFGMDNLIIIDPKCNPLDNEAIKRAKHASDLLKKAKIAKKYYLKQFDYLIATTSQLGTDYNIPRSPISPEQLAKLLRNKSKKIKFGILVGREGKGLSNKEILASDFVVTIPTSKKYPTMNMSHSVAIICYEFHKAMGKDKIGEQILAASKKDKEIVYKLMNQVLDNIDFSTKEKKETQRKVWKRIIGKSMLTKREAFALCGFFRKIMK